MVSALWLSLILAILSIGMITLSQDTLIEIKTRQKLEKAWLQSESGLSIAKFNIAKRQNPWAPRQEPYIASINASDIQIYIISPRGKVDINHASAALLGQLFSALGYSPDRAAKLSDSILDWRDPDDLERLNGAEKTAYRSAGLTFGPANRPFNTVPELRGVLGISYADYQCVFPFLTTFSQNPNLEPAYVVEPLRELMGLPPGTDNLDVSFRRSSLAGQVFEISAYAPYSEYTFARVTEVIRYTGIPSDPIWVHRQDRTMVKAGAKQQAVDLTYCPLDKKQ